MSIERLPELRMDGTRNILVAAGLMLKHYPNELNDKEAVEEAINNGLIPDEVVSAAIKIAEKDPDILLANGFDAKLLVRLMNQIHIINSPRVSFDVDNVGDHDDGALTKNQHSQVFQRVYSELILTSDRIIKHETQVFMEELEAKKATIYVEAFNSADLDDEAPGPR